MATTFKLFSGASAIVAVLSLLGPNRVATSNKTTHSDWTICEARDSLSCRCTRNILIDVIARCRLNHVTELKRIIKVPQNVVQINLSGNNIQDIPRDSFENYTQLIYLSLSSNEIHTISQGAFTGLTRLRELNLQDNMIHHWDSTLIHQDLPNLTMLNIAQNMYWKPDQQILSLPNLKVIYLLLESLYYAPPFSCFLLKNKTAKLAFLKGSRRLRNMEMMVDTDSVLLDNGHCIHRRLKFRNMSFLDAMYKNGFYLRCVESISFPLEYGTEISRYHQNKWYKIRFQMKPSCWNVIQKIHILTLVEGICAMVFNLIVILTTLRSRVLRESVAHVLVANIAVGDLLFSVYLIAITTTRNSMPSEEYYEFYQPYYCRLVGFVCLVGLISSPLMSFIMTLERYLAVVYCMKPHIRITRTMCFVAIATVWCLSISLAVSFMTSPLFAIQTDDMCIPLSNVNGEEVLHYVSGITITLYITAISLYVHMYRDFQKTNQKTVQLQRENRLARRIALIVFTNIIFLIIPLLLTPVVNNPLRHFISNEGRVIYVDTFAITCMGINSSFNPVLFSFRNEKFRNEFRKLLPFRRNSVGSSS